MHPIRTLTLPTGMSITLGCAWPAAPVPEEAQDPPPSRDDPADAEES